MENENNKIQKSTRMKEYKIEADIYVYGCFKNKEEALNELQVMLNDYDDCNDTDSDICIIQKNIEELGKAYMT